MNHPLLSEDQKLLRQRVVKLLSGSYSVLGTGNIVFVCGGNAATDMRMKFADYCRLNAPDVDVFFPEFAMKNYFNSERIEPFDIGDFEQLVGELSHSIVLFPEAPGSFAEAGYFSVVPELVKKTLLVLDARRQGNDSFLSMGPAKKFNSYSHFAGTLQLDYSNPDFAQIVGRIGRFPFHKNRKNLLTAKFNDHNPYEILCLIYQSVKLLRIATISDVLFVFRAIFKSRLSPETVKRVMSVLVGAGYLEGVGEYGHYSINPLKNSFTKIRIGSEGEESLVKLELVQHHTQLSLRQLLYYASTASKRYKCYPIPKKGGGERLIEHPSREIKAIQRLLNAILIESLDVHEMATAYNRGDSTLKNAELHKSTLFSVRFDFRNFFPSFSDRHIATFLKKLAYWKLTDEDVDFFVKIVCRDGRLTIGAPTSPKLTNAMMFLFDYRMYEWCRKNRLVYTRYADDIFVSAREPEMLGSVRAELNNACAEFEYGSLVINEAKTQYLSKRYKRSISGLVITPQHRISIGRDRKRALKSRMFKALKGDFEADELPRIVGWLSYVRHVEPEFFSSILRKYRLDDVETFLRLANRARSKQD